MNVWAQQNLNAAFLVAGLAAVAALYLYCGVRYVVRRFTRM